MRILGFLISMFLLSPQAFAWPPLFGPEVEFTNSEMSAESRAAGGATVNVASAVAAQRAMRDKVKALCLVAPRCQIRSATNSYGVTVYRVTFSDGWWFQVSTDPGVVELQFAPATLKGFKKRQALLKTHVYDVAEELGLHVDVESGANHLHLDLAETFGGNALLFRNFLVDWFNHSLVLQRILNGDLYNSPPISAQSLESRHAFKAAIEAFDRGEIKTIEALSRKILDEVYSTTYSGWNPPEKYQAINLTRVFARNAGARTVEMRAVRSAESAEGLLLQMTLIENHIKWLKTQRQPIPLNLERVEKGTLRELLESSCMEFLDLIGKIGMTYSDFGPIMNGSRKRACDRVAGVQVPVSACDPALFRD